MTADNPELNFSGQSEIVTDYCFEFTTDGNRLSSSQLDRFNKKLDFPSEFGEENKFTIQKCSAIQVSPSISFDKNYRQREKYPQIFSISMGELVDSRIPSNGENNKNEDKILLTTYGVCVVRIHSKNINKEKENTDKFIKSIRELRENQKNKAKDYFDIFAKHWNNKLNLPTISTNNDIKNKHTTTFVKNPYIIYNGDEYTISSIFENGNNKKVDAIVSDYHIKKQIVGISMLSRMWREYTENYVDNALNRDLSATTNEFQLLNSTHSLILRDENGVNENSHSGVKFDDYFTDMVFGIENYLIIRS